MIIIEGYSLDKVLEGVALLKEGKGVGFTDSRTSKEVNEIYSKYRCPIKHLRNFK
jgi:hypothetical protein